MDYEKNKTNTPFPTPNRENKLWITPALFTTLSLTTSAFVVSLSIAGAETSFFNALGLSLG